MDLGSHSLKFCAGNGGANSHICSSAPSKELLAELWVRAEAGNCFSCCSEIYLYLQVCLELHSASRTPTNGLFQLFRIHSLPGLQISSLFLNWL